MSAPRMADEAPQRGPPGSGVAVSSDNVTPIRSANAGALPPRKILEQRLEEQRTRVLNAYGICVLAARRAETGEDQGGFDSPDLLALRTALDGLCELLDSIKMAIDPEDGTLLDVEVRVGELSE
jgi:hypothetical protein